LLPYARQQIDDDDVASVAAVLRSDWLTTGPAVDVFENAIANFSGARHGVSVSSGTAALHAAMYALGVGPGDEVVVPAMTFAATANVVVYQGATPVFADVEPDTLLISPASVCQKLGPKTKAILAVDYTGQPCDYEALAEIVRGRDITLVADACHSLGATDRGRPVGTLARLTAFSFHPVKQITTAEGGMIVTDDEDLAARARRFRNHGLSNTHKDRACAGSWEYDMVDIGYNYRLSDVQCALGTSQLAKLPGWLKRRHEIAARYDRILLEGGLLIPLRVRPGVSHAYHLYVAQLSETGQTVCNRQELFTHLRAHGVTANVHYKPVHLHTYYRTRFDTQPGLCPVAEGAYQRIISLPMFPAMTDSDVDRVCDAVASIASLEKKAS
jgi:UDP-4-amino-4,6-dideoxy-N-acetyl-beta-L-altrosamine transaminase